MKPFFKIMTFRDKATETLAGILHKDIWIWKTRKKATKLKK